MGINGKECEVLGLISKGCEWLRFFLEGLGINEKNWKLLKRIGNYCLLMKRIDLKCTPNTTILVTSIVKYQLNIKLGVICLPQQVQWHLEGQSH